MTYQKTYLKRKNSKTKIHGSTKKWYEVASSVGTTYTREVQLKYEEKYVQPIDRSLISFGGDQVLHQGTIILSARVGEQGKRSARSIHCCRH